MKNKPKYYRQEFEGWLSCIYDPLIKFFSFGFENKIRNKLFQYTPENPKRIVDLCCGTGSLTILHKKHFPKAQIFGIDLSAKMLRKAKAKSKKTDISYQQKNIEKTGFSSNSIDLVTISFGIHEIPDTARENVFAEVYRILKPRGIFLIFDYKKLRKGYFLRKIYNLFIHKFEPYATGFIEKSGKELLQKFNFRNIEEHRQYKIFRIIKAQK